MFGFFLFLNFSLSSFLLQKLLGHGYYSLPPPKKNPQTNNVLWSKLDRDAVGEIMSRLCAVDQARFRAVCKAFRAMPSFKILKSLPWYVTVDGSPMTQALTVQLYDPSASSTPAPTVVHTISLPNLGIQLSTHTYFRVIETKGWLFIFITENNGNGNGIFRHKYLVLVYSPLTKQLIQLPAYYSNVNWWYVATFSTNPTSPDCIFFIAETYEMMDKCIFRTIRNGDKKWTIREFERNLHYFPCLPNIVYADEEGIFYLFSRYGQLASYDIINGELKYENIIKCHDFAQHLGPKIRRLERFMLNGELMFMFFGNHYLEPDKFPENPCIRSYDWSNKVWIPVTSLGDQTLFVRQRCRGVGIIGKEAIDDNRVLSNKIYYFYKAGCIIYSFENGDLVQSKFCPGTTEDTTTGTIEDTTTTCVVEFKYNSAIRYGNSNKPQFWFDPPVIRVK